MADTKISALPASTTPLAGTEVLPIVQSSTTKQVSVANLTAGRAVSAASLTLTSTPLATSSGGTGLSSFTANGLVFASSTSVLATSSNITYNGSSLNISGKNVNVTGGGLGYRVDGVVEIDRDQDYGWLKIGTTDSQVRFYTNSGLRQTIDTNGNIYVPAGSTSMTNGFYYIPAAAGAPSGTPTSVSGCVPMYYDTTNNKFYIYNGAWKGVSLT